MNRTLGMFLLVTCVSACLIGCNKPDPRKNPDFKEETLADPMKIQMAPIPNKTPKM